MHAQHLSLKYLSVPKSRSKPGCCAYSVRLKIRPRSIYICWFTKGYFGRGQESLQAPEEREKKMGRTTRCLSPVLFTYGHASWRWYWKYKWPKMCSQRIQGTRLGSKQCCFVANVVSRHSQSCSLCFHTAWYYHIVIWSIEGLNRRAEKHSGSQHESKIRGNHLEMIDENCCEDIWITLGDTPTQYKCMRFVRGYVAAGDGKAFFLNIYHRYWNSICPHRLMGPGETHSIFIQMLIWVSLFYIA